MSFIRTSTALRTLTPLSFRQRQTFPALGQQQRKFAEKKSKEKEDDSSSKDNPKPKILEPMPAVKETAEVKKHNKEFEERTERASNKIDPQGKMYKLETDKAKDS